MSVGKVAETLNVFINDVKVDDFDVDDLINFLICLRKTLKVNYKYGMVVKIVDSKNISVTDVLTVKQITYESWVKSTLLNELKSFLTSLNKFAQAKFKDSDKFTRFVKTIEDCFVLQQPGINGFVIRIDLSTKVKIDLFYKLNSMMIKTKYFYVPEHMLKLLEIALRDREVPAYIQSAFYDVKHFKAYYKPALTYVSTYVDIVKGLYVVDIEFDSPLPHLVSIPNISVSTLRDFISTQTTTSYIDPNLIEFMYKISSFETLYNAYELMTNKLMNFVSNVLLNAKEIKVFNDGMFMSLKICKIDCAIMLIDVFRDNGRIYITYPKSRKYIDFSDKVMKTLIKIFTTLNVSHKVVKIKPGDVIGIIVSNFKESKWSNECDVVLKFIKDHMSQI